MDQYLEQLGKPEKSANIQLSRTGLRVSAPSVARSEVRIPPMSGNRAPARSRLWDPDYAYLHGNSERYSWAYGDWTPCSNGCGTGRNIFSKTLVAAMADSKEARIAYHLGSHSCSSSGLSPTQTTIKFLKLLTFDKIAVTPLKFEQGDSTKE